MALLLQRCLSQCCTSQGALSLSTNVRQDRPSSSSSSAAGMGSRSIRCGATCEGNGSVSQHPASEDAAQTPKVFQDESNGIVCYRNRSGELTCEGWDEGPHFEPERQEESRAGISKRSLERMAARAMQVTGAVSLSSELVGYKLITGRKGESMCEGMDES